MPTRASVAVLVALLLWTAADASAQRVVADEPFAPGGTIELDLDGGAYEIRPGTDRIRVIVDRLDGARVSVRVDGRRARVRVRDTPSSFDAVIEVPQAEHLDVELNGGVLDVEAIARHLDVENGAGNVTIAVSAPARYARVDAAVLAGNIEADPFRRDTSGLFRSFEWRGDGTDTLDVWMGAGNLVLRRR